NELTLASIVRLQSDAVSELAANGDQCTIRSGAREFEMPAAALPALKVLEERGAIAIGALPDSLDDDSKLVLVRRLMAGGIVDRAEYRPRSSGVLPRRIDRCGSRAGPACSACRHSRKTSVLRQRRPGGCDGRSGVSVSSDGGRGRRQEQTGAAAAREGPPRDLHRAAANRRARAARSARRVPDGRAGAAAVAD